MHYCLIFQQLDWIEVYDAKPYFRYCGTQADLQVIHTAMAKNSILRNNLIKASAAQRWLEKQKVLATAELDKTIDYLRIHNGQQESTHVPEGVWLLPTIVALST